MSFFTTHLLCDKCSVYEARNGGHDHHQANVNAGFSPADDAGDDDHVWQGESRTGQEGLIPSGWVSSAVGGNGIAATLFASVAGALMYFATLTEVPILEGLIGSGMGKGPALALLLAGPALSLPNMLVIRSVIGTKKTAVYATVVIAGSALAGLVYGVLP